MRSSGRFPTSCALQLIRPRPRSLRPSLPMAPSLAELQRNNPKSESEDPHKRYLEANRVQGGVDI